MRDSPGEARVAELLGKVRSGSADDATREELALYCESDSGLSARIESAEKEAALGGQWLARVEADEAIAQHERRHVVVVERGAGLALTGAGYLASLAFPVVGGAIMVTGIGLLGWSFLRTRLATWRDDPYRDVDK